MAECCFAAGLIFAPANLHFGGYSFAAESWVAADAASVAGLSLAVGNSIAFESSSTVHDSLADEVHRAAEPASAVGDLHVADVVLAGELVVAGFCLDHRKKHYQKPREGTNEVHDPDGCMAVDELLCGDIREARAAYDCMSERSSCEDMCEPHAHCDYMIVLSAYVDMKNHHAPGDCKLAHSLDSYFLDEDKPENRAAGGNKFAHLPCVGINELHVPDDGTTALSACGDMIAADGLHGCMKRALAALVIYSTCL